jgi:hypothetical protein
MYSIITYNTNVQVRGAADGLVRRGEEADDPGGRGEDHEVGVLKYVIFGLAKHARCTKEAH